jgi:toxin-antitoxin system PIN domain toxin
VIAVDTNILVYAHREDSPWHERAFDHVRRLAESRGSWAIPWPCVHEFLAIVTHPRIYAPPTPLAHALDQLRAWRESPTLTFIGEGSDYLDMLFGTVEAGRITGPRVHDARIAAICHQHGVQQLWSADRDFSRFSEPEIVNPLVG